MRVIDFHTHVYPDAIAQKAAASVRTFYQLGDATMDGTVSSLLKLGTEAGTDRFVILPVAMRPDRVRGINQFILDQLAEQPRFYGFGTVHAAMVNLEEEIQFIMDKGLKGVKMHPDSQVFPIDDLRLYPMYDMLQDKLPIIIHMGDCRYNYSHPLRLRKVLEAFPRLQVIAAHFGGYNMYETAREVLTDTDCFFDVSSSLMFLEPGVAEKYIRHYGSQRFVYGSDYPMWNPVNEIRRFTGLKLTEKEFDQISHETAEFLLKIK